MLQPDISNEDIQQAAIALMQPVNDQKENPVKIDKDTLIRECHNALSHKYRAKAIYKRMDYELLCWCRDLITTLIEKKEIEINQQKEKNRKRNEVMQKVSALLHEEGFSLDELYSKTPSGDLKKTDTTDKPKRTYKKRDPNYRRTTTYKFQFEIFNKTYYWTGTGYLPKPLRCHLAKGHTLESCYLPKDQWVMTTKTMDKTIPDEFSEQAKKLINEANKQGIGKKRSELVIDFYLG